MINLAGGLAVIELFSQEFNPLQHGGLKTHTGDTDIRGHIRAIVENPQQHRS